MQKVRLLLYIVTCKPQIQGTLQWAMAHFSILWQDSLDIAHTGGQRDLKQD